MVDLLHLDIMMSYHLDTLMAITGKSTLTDKDPRGVKMENFTIGDNVVTREGVKDLPIQVITLEALVVGTSIVTAGKANLLTLDRSTRKIL